jgi:electron transport complex protein RnfC
MFHRFFGGVHPHNKKNLSKDAEITELSKAPAQVIIPMTMHVGVPCTPLVKQGDTVLAGQKIGEIGGLGAPIHASVSGTVTAVELRPHPLGDPVQSVVIQNDFQNTPPASPSKGKDPQALTPQELIALVKEAGITGMGGAGFPTHAKLSGAAGTVDTVILNGAECEPYLTADYRLMMEQGSKIIGGARLIGKMLGLNKVHIGVEANKRDAVAALRQLASEGDDEIKVEVCYLRVRYPQGAERQLIQTITGRQLPPGKLPAEVKCAVFNVSTAAAIYDAVSVGKPLTHRVVTVSGEAVEKPGNYLVPIGTPMEHLIREAGGFRKPPDRVLMGGPMMGISQLDLSVPVIKGTNAILALPLDICAPVGEESVCIRCGRCVDACPMHLMPLYIHLYASHGRLDALEPYHVEDCMECSSCTYGCPAGIPLTQEIRTVKNQLRMMSQQKR